MGVKVAGGICPVVRVVEGAISCPLTDELALLDEFEAGVSPCPLETEFSELLWFLDPTTPPTTAAMIMTITTATITMIPFVLA